MIIGLNSRGYVGVGKDYIAMKLCEAIPSFEIYSFSTELVREISGAYGLPENIFTERATKETKLKCLAYRNCGDLVFKQVLDDLFIPRDVWLSPREVMQYWGTEFRRELWGNDYWVTKVPKNKNLVIPTTRYQNEFDICDVVVKVGSSHFGQFIGFGHSSEKDTPEWDFFVRNEVDSPGAINSLIAKIKAISLLS
jgi:hypothetical protein